jgi:hypothetical protein
MKDEFDDVTPDMFDKAPEKVKKVSKPDMRSRDAAKAMTTDVIAKASGRGGVSSGNAGASDMRFMKGIGNKPDPTYKKGGKVAGKLATRGYGKAR